MQISYPFDLRVILAGGLRIVFIIITGYIFIRVGDSVVKRAVSRYIGESNDPRRVKTMTSVLGSVVRYTVDFVAFASVLEVLGISAGSVLAGAGIVGLAVGFGAQNLVKDIITGFFILFDNQFSVGDYVTVSGVTGVVEDVGLRVTKIRGEAGELHVIPNSAIDRSANMSRGNTLARVDVPVSVDEKIGRISGILTDAIRLIPTVDPVIVEGPQLLGPIAMTETAVVFRITARTQPLQQWAVERRIRAAVKEAFEHEGVRSPSVAVVRKE